MSSGQAGDVERSPAPERGHQPCLHDGTRTARCSSRAHTRHRPWAAANGRWTGWTALPPAAEHRRPRKPTATVYPVPVTVFPQRSRVLLCKVKNGLVSQPCMPPPSKRLLDTHKAFTRSGGLPCFLAVKVFIRTAAGFQRRERLFSHVFYGSQLKY